MGTETFAKNGQVSVKPHSTTKMGEEHYKRSMNEMCPPLGGGPEGFERKYSNEYRKEALPEIDSYHAGSEY